VSPPVAPGAPTTEIGYAVDTSTTSLVVAGGGLPSWQTLAEDTHEYVDELSWPRSVYTYQRMRNDAQIDGLMRGFTWPIRNYDWAIDPRDCPPDAAQRLADDLGLPLLGEEITSEATSARHSRASADEHLRMALLALVFGHMYFEQVGEIDADGWWRLTKLAPRMPSSIDQILVARDGGLVGIRQLGSDVVIPVNRLVGYVWDREGGNWYGRSILRAAYAPWLIKDRLYRIDTVKHERTGMGVPIITLPEGASEAQRQAALQMAEQFRGGDLAGGALPFGHQLSLVGVQGSTSDVLGSIRYYDELIARMLMMMFTQLGTTETGSRALGQSFMDFFSLALSAVAEWYAGVVDAFIIADWVEWNLGEDAPTPQLVFAQAPERVLAPPDLVGLINAGAVVVDEELREWIAHRYDMPAPPPDAPLPSLGGPTNPTTSPTSQPGSAPPAETQPATLASVEAYYPPGRDVGPTPPKATSPAWPYHRQPFRHEVQAAVDYPGLDRDFQKALEATLKTYQAQVRPAQLRAIEAAAAAGDIGQILSALDAAGLDGVEVIAQGMHATARSGVKHALAEAQAQGEAIPEPPLDTARTLRRAASTDTLLRRSLAQSAYNKAAILAPDGIGTPAVAGGVMSYLKGLTDAWLRDQLVGALTSAQNEGRQAVFETAAGAGMEASYYASEVLDDATCDECQAIDGTQFDTLADAQDAYPTGGYSDCLGGPRCRGTIVVVYGTSGVEGSALRAYSDDQPRDETGRWTSGGGGGDGGGEAAPADAGSAPGAPPGVQVDPSKIGPDGWPVKDEGATAVLGEAANTQEMYTVGRDANGAPIYSPDRAGVHDAIVAGATEGHASQEDPRALFMAGGPASGKSTALAGLEAQGSDLVPKDAVNVNPDEVKSELPEYNQIKDTGSLYAATGVHEESSDIAKRITNEAIANGQNMTVDGTGDSGGSKFPDKLEAAAQTHQVDVMYATRTTQGAVDQQIDRVAKTGRYVPEEEQRYQHAQVSAVYPKVEQMAYEGKINSVRVYDTDTKTTLATVSAGSREIHDPVGYQRFLDKANEYTGPRKVG